MWKEGGKAEQKQLFWQYLWSWTSWKSNFVDLLMLLLLFLASFSACHPPSHPWFYHCKWDTTGTKHTCRNLHTLVCPQSSLSLASIITSHYANKPLHLSAAGEISEMESEKPFSSVVKPDLVIRAGNFTWSSSGSDKGRNWEARHNLSYQISFIWLIDGGLEESKSYSESAATSKSMLVFCRHPKYPHQTSGCLGGKGCIHCRLHSCRDSQ